jgi:hypothetical protein
MTTSQLSADQPVVSGLESLAAGALKGQPDHATGRPTTGIGDSCAAAHERRHLARAVHVDVAAVASRVDFQERLSTLDGVARFRLTPSTRSGQRSLSSWPPGYVTPGADGSGWQR